MIKLCEKLETEVEIAGHLYEVNMSYDNIIKLLDLIKHTGLRDGEKVYLGIYLLLGIELELEAKQQVLVFETLIEKFVHDGDVHDVQIDLDGNVMPVAKSQEFYDLNHDAGYIYTSFRKAYGMNLYEEQGKLDWREFKQLLQDLPDDTKFRQVVDIRTRDYPKGKGMSEERRKLKELKRAFALPHTVIDD